jgi:hypothetical protein
VLATAGSESIVSMVTYARETIIKNDITKLNVFLLNTNESSFLNKSTTKLRVFNIFIFPSSTTKVILT